MTEEIRDTHYSKLLSRSARSPIDQRRTGLRGSSHPSRFRVLPALTVTSSSGPWTDGRTAPDPSQCGPLFDDEIAVKFRVQGHDPLVRHEGAHLPIARQACLDALDDPILALLSRGLDQHRRSRDPRPFVLRKHHLQRGAVFRSTGISAEELCQVIYVFERLVCTLAEVLSSIA